MIHSPPLAYAHPAPQGHPNPMVYGHPLFPIGGAFHTPLAPGPPLPPPATVREASTNQAVVQQVSAAAGGPHMRSFRNQLEYLESLIKNLLTERQYRQHHLASHFSKARVSFAAGMKMIAQETTLNGVGLGQASVQKDAEAARLLCAHHMAHKDQTICQLQAQIHAAVPPPLAKQDGFSKGPYDLSITSMEEGLGDLMDMDLQELLDDIAKTDPLEAIVINA